MKNALLSLFILLFCTNSLLAQQHSLQGVYKMNNGNAHALWLFVDGYCSMIHYNEKAYLSTTGGPYTFDGNTILVQTEYNDLYPNAVGKTSTHPVKLDGENIMDNTGNTWVKQNAKPSELTGLWRITERQQNREMTAIPRGDRKTIKLLVDGFFQWIAINPAEQGFYGCGGGEYTFKDNKYAEHLIFFSRDDTRVGSSLQFDGEVKNGQWHHSGLSSKGIDIYEVWSREPK